MKESARKELEQLASKVRKTRGSPFELTVGGWHFVMDRGYLNCPGTHLSAMLVPRGRSSSNEDWGFLGTAVAILGAPEGSLLSSFEITNPP